METVQYRTLGTKTFVLFALQRLAPACAFLVLYVFSFMNTASLGVAFLPVVLAVRRVSGVCVFLFALLGLFVAWIAYTHYRYALDEHALRIRKGFFHKQELAIPYRQIQNVHIERRLLDQLLGVSHLVILTGGEDEDAVRENSEGILPVIDYRQAMSIQQDLMRRANVQEVREVTRSPNSFSSTKG